MLQECYKMEARRRDARSLPRTGGITGFAAFAAFAGFAEVTGRLCAADPRTGFAAAGMNGRGGDEAGWGELGCDPPILAPPAR